MKIKDIAKLSGVSIATVSRVMNNKSDVNKHTREKILKIIKDNDYRPSSIARNLVKNENNTIGVIIPDIKNLYFANIMNEIVSISNKKGLNVILGCSNEDFKLQNKYIDLFLKERVKGIIIVVTKNSMSKIKYFEDLEKKIPLVFIDRKISEKFSGIYLENYKTTLNSIQKIIDKGAKKIAFISGPLDVSTALERYNGYIDALKKNSIKIDESNIYYGDFSMESGYDIGKKISKKKLDALYISNNLMTFGLIKAFKELNKDIQKYQVATFENNEILDFMENKIESHIIPFKQLSLMSLELLEEIILKKVDKKIIKINPLNNE